MPDDWVIWACRSCRAIVVGGHIWHNNCAEPRVEQFRVVPADDADERREVQDA